MVSWLSRRIVHDAWYVTLVWAALAMLFLISSLTGWGGPNVFERLHTGLVGVPGSQSAEGHQILDTLTDDSIDVTLLVTGVPLESSSQQQAVASAMETTHKDLMSMVGEANVLDPFVVPGMLEDPAGQLLAAKDRQGFLLIVTVDPPKDASLNPEQIERAQERLREQVEQRLSEVPQALHSVAPHAQGVVSDQKLITQSITDQVEADMITGELIALPLALIIMVFVFGGFILAGMPLIGALVSIACALGITYLLTLFTTVESFAVNIITVIGLGLSIDYALLMTSRYREERLALLAAGEQDSDGFSGRRRRRRRTGRRSPVVQHAVTNTLNTAGRTIIFSALTVAVCLLGLALMRPTLLRSIGIAGVMVVLLAVAAALTLVPSLLVLLGDRIDHPTVFSRIPKLHAIQQRLSDVSSRDGVFASLARRIHRSPWPVLAGCLVFLIVCCLPVGNLHMLSSTAQLVPPHSEQAKYLQLLARDYPAATAHDTTLIIAGTGEDVDHFITHTVASLPEVSDVLHTAKAGNYTVVSLDVRGGNGSREAEEAVRAIRHLPAPAQVWVTGQAANQVDFAHSLATGLPWVGLLVIAATFALLFLMTGSVLVPIKALIINALSLTASLGITTWIFQGGHGSSLLDFTPIGGVESTVVVVALAFGFGLSMDYEVFLLSRIKEYRDAGDDNDAAVEHGLQRSGRIITSAAVMMVIVFGGFVAGDLLVVKEIGLALAIMVFMDATLVRMLLVPATMTILGEWNWWAPEKMNRFYQQYALSDGGHLNDPELTDRRTQVVLTRTARSDTDNQGGQVSALTPSPVPSVLAEAGTNAAGSLVTSMVHHNGVQKADMSVASFASPHETVSMSDPITTSHTFSQHSASSVEHDNDNLAIVHDKPITLDRPLRTSGAQGVEQFSHRIKQVKDKLRPVWKKARSKSRSVTTSLTDYFRNIGR
ncbi:MMPL family transporter [Actinomyces vulturis]|uniref:MMPL family transporter n=1 Tax=Actinomyces vulturis TaxID=1857645 RepID=UPI00083579CC|nr:MMPL family transporter [Actinomyces vulturis]